VLTFCIARIPLTHEVEKSERDYEVHGTKWEISNFAVNG
jgi:hypothetical protein